MYKTVMILSLGTNWLKASDLRPEPFEETLLQLEKFNENMKQKYRSIGIMDDFSHIVNNMIGSLQEVQVGISDLFASGNIKCWISPKVRIWCRK